MFTSLKAAQPLSRRKEIHWMERVTGQFSKSSLPPSLPLHSPSFPPSLTPSFSILPCLAASFPLFSPPPPSFLHYCGVVPEHQEVSKAVGSWVYLAVGIALGKCRGLTSKMQVTKYRLRWVLPCVGFNEIGPRGYVAWGPLSLQLGRCLKQISPFSSLSFILAFFFLKELFLVIIL